MIQGIGGTICIPEPEPGGRGRHLQLEAAHRGGSNRLHFSASHCEFPYSGLTVVRDVASSPFLVHAFNFAEGAAISNFAKLTLWRFRCREKIQKTKVTCIIKPTSRDSNSGVTVREDDSLPLTFSSNCANSRSRSFGVDR